MTGRAYLEKGRPVVEVARFRLPSKSNPPAAQPSWLVWFRPPAGAPRNSAVRRADGTCVVRPFRGLRRPT